MIFIRQAALAICLGLTTALPAFAQDCKTPPEAGIWVHPRPKTGILSKLEIQHFCAPDPRFGEWKVRAHSKCTPRDCTWGYATAQRAGRDGLLAGFQGFFSIRFINATALGGRMEVDVRIVFHDTAKSDQTYTVMLERQ